MLSEPIRFAARDPALADNACARCGGPQTPRQVWRAESPRGSSLRIFTNSRGWAAAGGFVGILSLNFSNCTERAGKCLSVFFFLCYVALIGVRCERSESRFRAGGY